jgi:phage baseplate assembly protein V
VSDPFELAELARRLANLIRVGTVAEADYARARLRIALGDITTGWLPFAVSRAGDDRSWSAPSIGEQVLVVCPSGDPVQGIVVGALYQAAHPAPADQVTIHRTVYEDGTVVEYDRAAHRLMVRVVGDLRVETAGRVEIAAEGPVAVSSAAEASITAQGPVSVSSEAQVSIAAPAVAMTGTGGNSATASLTGDFTLRGRLEVEGSIHATGDILADGSNSNHHTH